MTDFHPNGDKKVLTCDTCLVDFTSRYNYDRHVKSKNCFANLNHECKSCKAGFVTPLKLKTHILKNCPKKYFCQECFTFFKIKTLYENHVLGHSEQ